MKKFLLVASMAWMPLFALAQSSVQGKLLDSAHGTAIPGARLHLEGGSSLKTDENGNFMFGVLNAGLYTLDINSIGFTSRKIQIRVPGSENLTVYLQERNVLTEEVIVRATRSNAKDGTVYSSVTKSQIERNNLGQDLPYLVNSTPSAVVTSDGGTGIGYTGLRIRGSDPTRINVTINGIPYNDAESQQTYFVDVPDLASSIDNIQIQRGVGTSTNGAGAFGGSLNIQTSSLSPVAYAESDNAYGYYNSLKTTLKFGTGLIDGKWAFDGRFSRISSDGYIDRATANLKSFFFSGAYYGKSDLLRINVFSGMEKTYQAWNGVPQDSLLTNRRFNVYTYPNQTDNYTQDHFQILYSKKLDSSWLLNAALHLTHGKGYYEEYEAGQNFADYGLQPVVIGNTEIDTTSLIRRQWLDNYFYGVTYSAQYHPDRKFNFTIGGAYNQYRGLHYGEIIWAQYASNSQIRTRYYDNNTLKTDFNIFGKSAWTLGSLTASLDLQYRRVYYLFSGIDEFRTPIGQKAYLNFFNPKFGLNEQIDENNVVYASYGVANKEPNRDDYVQSTPDARPKPENLQDIEAGYRYAEKKFSASVNFFYMDYYNQLVLTGKLNDVGDPIRENVPQSYRAGIELEAKYRITNWFSWSGNLALSRNRIREYHEVLYDENYSNPVTNIYQHSDIAFSPDIVGASIFDFMPFKDLHVSLLSKYVGTQYLDNTSHQNRRIDPYFLNDIKLAYSFKTRLIPEIQILLSLNNIGNVYYESNGSAYPYYLSTTSQVINSNYLYPQAPFNMSAGVNLKF